MLSVVHGEYLACGNSDGTIRFYDLNFKVVAWFEDLNLTTIKSISFSKTDKKRAVSDFDTDIKDAPGKVLECSDFIVADDSALICMLESTIFEQIDPKNKKGQTIFHGLKSSISAIAVHPHKPIVAIAGSEGFVLFWDFINKVTLPN